MLKEFISSLFNQAVGIVRPRLLPAPQRRRRSKGRNQPLFEALDSIVLLTSNISLAVHYTSSTAITLNLASDDAAIAANGTIFVDYGDNSGTIVHGTASPVTHTYNDTQSHTLTAYVADSLAIAANETVSFGSPYSVLLLSDLTINNGTGSSPLGTLDLTNRDMIIQCADSTSAATMLTQVTAWLHQGYDFGAWDGTGIISSVAATSSIHALGILNTAGDGNALYTMFDGIPVDANSVLVRFTYLGDLNLSGDVDDNDLFQFFAAYFGTQIGPYYAGDLNYDGLVDDNDLFIFVGNYYSNPATLAAPDGVPLALATSDPLPTHPAALSLSNPTLTTSGTQATYTLTFSAPVTGVDASDFTLATTGTVTGASILAVAAAHTGPCDTYTVTVATGTGWGTLRLDLADDDSIADAFSHPLGGPGAGNGYFFGPTLEPSIAFTTSTSNSLTDGTIISAEGTPVGIHLATNAYTPPSDTAWTIDFGDGITDTQTASTPTFSHNYTTGDGSYNVTIQATTADGDQLYSDFIPIAVTPAAATSFSATANSDGSVALAWAETSDLLDYFDLLVSHSGTGGTYTLYAAGISRAARAYTLSNLNGDTDFAFQLVSTNAGGTSAPATVAATTLAGDSGTLDPQDDDPSAYVYLGFGINFYGMHADHAYVNNNGNITFDSGHSTYSPIDSMSASAYAMIAPFFADVDTRLLNSVAGGTVTYGPENYSGNQAFAVHWTAVDYYSRLSSGHSSLYNTFTLYIVNQGTGNFDIVFDYGDLYWDTGDLSGGIDGLADPNVTSYPARAGFTNGSTRSGTSYELPFSGTSGGLLSAEAHQTETYTIRNAPLPHFVLQDLTSGSFFDDTNKRLLGAVKDTSGQGRLAIHLTRPSGTTLDDVYSFVVLDSSGNQQYSASLDPDGSDSFYSPSETGLHTVKIKSSIDATFEESVRYYLAKMDIVWTGADTTYGSGGTAQIISNGTDVSGHDVSHLNLYTGQKIALGADVGYSLLGSDIVNTKWRFQEWTSRTFVTGWTHTNSLGQAGYLMSSDLNSNATTVGELGVYCVADMPAEVFTLTLTVNVGGSLVVFKNHTTINIRKPGQSIWTGRNAAGSPLAPDIFAVKAEINEPFINQNTNELSGLAQWETTLPAAGYVGQTNYVQLVSAYTYINGGGFEWTGFNNPNDFRLDDRYPYDFTLGDPQSSDQPHTGVAYWATYQIMNFRFHDWLMWTPPGADSIAIPVQTWDWNTSAHAYWNFTTSDWDLASVPLEPAHYLVINGVNTSVYPAWTKKV